MFTSAIKTVDCGEKITQNKNEDSKLPLRQALKKNCDSQW